MSKTSQSVDLPTAPLPVHCAQPKAVDAITTQPKAVPQMSVEDSEALRLRGGCDCLVGGVDVELGPCICYTHGHGLLGCLACLVVCVPNCVAGGLLGITNCLLCGACSDCHCGEYDLQERNRTYSY
ncbi:hypothetical protein DL93DRAFT_2234073 [Clavulina sp. PMI_390]|nr:hypothetical protein DL93DRAFT_2234073 [Clavulina sp. PMI_390]